MIAPIDEFTVSIKEMAEDLSVTIQTIHKWTIEGAFPFVQFGTSSKPRRMLHKSCLDMRMSEINKNKLTGKHKAPVMVLPTGKKAEKTSRLDELEARIDRLERQLMIFEKLALPGIN